MTSRVHGVARSPTRTEQRAATQAALLDETINSLIEIGYAATSTRGVAERAGVSQGALQNYFPTKADLVSAAVTQWFEQRGAAELQLVPATSISEREQAEYLLDRLWEMHNQQIIPAILEFLVAEQRNPEAADRLAASYNLLKPVLYLGAAAVIPSVSAIPGFSGWLDMTLAAIHGTVVFNRLEAIEPHLLDWKSLRAQLLRSLDALIAESSSCVPQD